MQAFVHLIETLDHCRGNGERVEAMAAHFAAVAPADAAWALQVLLAKRRRRLITGRRLREIGLEASGLPDWLFASCHAQVGDSAETVALLWPGEEPVVGAAEGEGAAMAQDAADAAVPQGAADAAVLQGAADAAVAPADQPLHVWMEELLPAAAALDGEEQAAAVRQLWRGLDRPQRLVAGKLLTGGLRVGVAQGLVVRALARCSGLEEALLQHRLMGSFTPSVASWSALLAPAEGGEVVASRPYPFFLASPLQRDPQSDAPLDGCPGDWLVEWKWDGIRGQLIHRVGGSFLWSRGEELIHEAFPELLEAAAALPHGTVIDGELLVWPPGQPWPAPFAQLQRRLGRRRPGRALLAEYPVVLVAYDLLEWNGEDLRGQPLSRRRAVLASLLQQPLQATTSPAAGLPGPGGEAREASSAGPLEPLPEAEAGGVPPGEGVAVPIPQAASGANAGQGCTGHLAIAMPPAANGEAAPELPLNPCSAALDALRQPPPPQESAPIDARLRLSPARPLANWRELEELRAAAAEVQAEGVMLKALASPYLSGRRRGHWWKHKREPHRLDAVLLYAQAGSGRRANLFTDYTFGLWDRPPVPGEDAADPLLVSDAAATDPSAGRLSAETPPPRLVSFAKAYSGLDDAEILELDRWIRSHTTERFGPVRAVQPVQVFELAFEGLQRSGRHKSGIAVRFPRISRWRRDKPAAEADTLGAALALLDGT